MVLYLRQGDYIDTTIGTGLGISTMAAAALGNTISDLAGIGSAWYVENIAVKIGIKAPELSPEQLEGMSARWSANVVRFSSQSFKKHCKRAWQWFYVHGWSRIESRVSTECGYASVAILFNVFTPPNTSVLTYLCFTRVMQASNVSYFVTHYHMIPQTYISIIIMHMIFLANHSICQLFNLENLFSWRFSILLYLMHMILFDQHSFHQFHRLENLIS